MLGLTLVDKYGYISFDGNFYWIPRGTSGDVTVLEYSKSIKIYHKRRMIGEYLFPPFGTKRKRITPDGVSPYYRPAKTTIPTDKEEMELNNLGGDVEQYLKIGIKKYSSNKKYRFIRKVYALHRQLSPSLFQKTISRALKYNVLEDGRLDGIAALIMGMDNYDLPSPDINSDYELRDEYVDAEYSSVPDLERYDNKYRGKHEKEN